MRYPKGYKNPIPEELELEVLRLKDLLDKIDRRFSWPPKPDPDPNLVDAYNAAVAKFNADVRPYNRGREMISMDYHGKTDIKQLYSTTTTKQGETP